MTRRTALQAMLAAMLVMVPVVVQAQPAPAVIYACVNNSSGTIHIVSATAACNANEMKLQWNIVGPPGPQGLKGDRGDPGPTNVFGLTVALGGEGHGAVTSSDDGISCGADCTEVYPAQTSVTLTAVPAIGSVFSGWAGDCSGTEPNCTLVLGTTRNVTALFDVRPPSPPPVSHVGLYTIVPSFAYSCVGGLVEFNISSFTITGSGGGIGVIPAPLLDRDVGIMGGSFTSAVSFTARTVRPGGISYELFGTFRTDPRIWDGVFTFTCSSPECDGVLIPPPCVNQTYTITGTYQPSP